MKIKGLQFKISWNFLTQWISNYARFSSVGLAISSFVGKGSGLRKEMRLAL